jgi:hypothetical protein
VPAVSVALRRRDARPALETRRYDDVVVGQLVNRAVSGTENGRVCAAAQDVEHVLDAGLPARGKAPQIGRPIVTARANAAELRDWRGCPGSMAAC